MTKGPLGADLYTAEWSVPVDGFAVDVVDTVGCGDAFMAALLAGLLATDLSRLDRAAARAIRVRASGRRRGDGDQGRRDDPDAAPG